MVSFDIKGDINDVVVFLISFKDFSFVELFGGVESLICYFVMMIYVGMEFKVCFEVGVGDIFICIFVGIEDVKDFIVDLDCVFNLVKLG